MRITNGMLITNMMRNYNKNMKDLAKLQEHLASGKKILRPSDDPVAISRSLKLKADLAYNKQYVSNTDNALSWLESTELALKDLGDVLQRVREMAVKAGSGSLSLEDRAAIADEIQQLQNHVVQLGNATYADRYIFAGYKTDQPAFAEQGNQLVYQGDNGKIAYETGVGSRIDVNVIGGDGGAEIDKIYDVLERFKNDLMDPANPELDGYIGEIESTDYPGTVPALGSRRQGQPLRAYPGQGSRMRK